MPPHAELTIGGLTMPFSRNLDLGTKKSNFSTTIRLTPIPSSSDLPHYFRAIPHNFGPSRRKLPIFDFHGFEPVTVLFGRLCCPKAGSKLGVLGGTILKVFDRSSIRLCTQNMARKDLEISRPFVNFGIGRVDGRRTSRPCGLRRCCTTSARNQRCRQHF